MNAATEEFDVGIVGGAGHVGLPLALVFAAAGQRVLVHDIAEDTLQMIRSGRMPFMERGAEKLLTQALADGTLGLSSSPEGLAAVDTVVITIGTPVDEFLHPSLKVVQRCLDGLAPYLRAEQLVVMRSTVYPGVTEWVARYLQSRGLPMDVAFCPERIVQGHGIEELAAIPQIVSGVTPAAEERAAALFERIAPSVVRLSPMEAEFSKLFSNAYRYINFAMANQFYMICESAGVDYYRVLGGLTKDYPRAKGIPTAGLAAGPCLFKDTMQLASYYKNQFTIGHSAMLVNEGLPAFVVEMLGRRAAEAGIAVGTVGLLGMAFKANNDDTRASLSYKLKKLCAFQGMQVLTTDPYVRSDASLLPVSEVVERSDALILCAPHADYRDLDRRGRLTIDIWNLWPEDAP